MSEHLVTNANDVELVMEGDSGRRGTPQNMGRIVVDDFTITREEDNSFPSGVGHRLPVGVSRGDVEFSFSFTMQGEDVDVFEMVATQDGLSVPFSFTAQKPPEDGSEGVEWQFALETCLAGTEELTGTSGDPMEYSVEGGAVSIDKQATRSDGAAAFDS